MKTYLLDAIPIASWLGAITTILVAIIGYFLKDAYSKITKKQEDTDEALAILKQNINDETRKLETRVTEGDKKLEDKLNDTHFKLLDKFQDIKDTINNARK